ncbi:hypothetical protein AB0O84_27835, partial [Streptomyces sp. NPDC088752]
LLIGRPQDAWLATWSRADAAVTLPVEPVEFAASLASLLRPSTGGTGDEATPQTPNDHGRQ